MKDTEANTGLIKHVYRRVEAFWDEFSPEDFDDLAQMERVFAQWLLDGETRRAA